MDAEGRQISEIHPDELCEACGRVVSGEDAFRAELAVSEAMCPSAMVFHQECYEKAAHLWKPDPESSCTYDTRFPETTQWPAAPPPT